jgi:hypothetical protein
LREGNPLAGWAYQSNLLDSLARVAKLRQVSQHQIVALLAD